MGHPLPQEHRGSFLLGSTTPDVRLFAGWERERTHFFKLESDGPGAGFAGMVHRHPNLGRSDRLGRETLAFMLGYLSHLAVDEHWIAQVYRRFFGRQSPMAGDPMANVLDRVLQFDMDRAEREGIADLEGALESIKGSYRGVEVGFIDQDLLRRWQEVVIQRTGRELPWERFGGYVRRVRRDVGEDEVERIVQDGPELAARVRSQVSDGELRRFREAALAAFAATAREYMGEEDYR
ncbi:MAG: hypothetical protein EXR49_09145 [Dehalococcoidia bacterium]|nr:hypothetical protein [Dehalococcoidia bacterium]